LLALPVLASVPVTFRLNDVRAWAIPNKSSPWDFAAFVAEASEVSEWTVPAPVPELMILVVAVAFPESAGQFDVEFCAEAFMMKSIYF
jgi:hypothetical protein